MSVDLVRIVDSIHRDKNISKDILFEGIQSALTTAARKHYPEAAEIEVRIDPDSGAIEATKDGVKMDPSELGRIAAQTAKQVIIQKIREAERDSLFDEFEDQRSDLVTGTVQRFEGGAVIVNLGKTDAILPRSEQIPGESYHPNERIRAIILDVRKVGQRVKIILSRTHPDFVRRLVRARDSRNRRSDHRDPGPGQRGRLPFEGGGHVDRHEGRCRRCLRGCSRDADQEHRRRAGGRADRHRAVERVAPGVDSERACSRPRSTR